MKMNTLDKGAELDLRGLLWVWDFGWLRPRELGRLLWPNLGHATKNAERHCRKWESNGLIIRRELPNHNGTAIVLSSKGADLLYEHGIKAKTGKDIGSTRKKTEEEKKQDEIKKKKEEEKNGNINEDESKKKKGKKSNEDIVWIPPATWKHDILSAGTLSILHENGHDIYPEMKLRRENPNIKKIPDGIIKWKRENKVTHKIWLEVEASRKSGDENIGALAKAVISAMNGKAQEVSGIICNHAIVAINPKQICDRGYSLNHKSRIKNKVEEYTEKDIKICFLELKLTGLGVSGYEMNYESIESNEIARTVNRLNKLWEKKHKSEKTEGRESELYINYAQGLADAELWKENEKWFLEYRDGDEIIKNEFNTMTDAKRFAAKVHLEYKKGQKTT